MAVTYSAATAHLWVAVSAGVETHVSLFAGSSTGNATPQRTIQGPATGLTGKVVTGLAESPHTRELFVLAKDAQFGSGQVLVFADLAQDNAAPLRTFTDASTQLADAGGIAIAAASTPVGVLGGNRANGVRLAVSRNPTQGSMSARIWMPRPVHALRLEVLDVTGRRLATIWSGDAPEGATSAQWDGRSAGRTQASGVYLLRATAAGVDETVRFVWIR